MEYNYGEVYDKRAAAVIDLGIFRNNVRAIASLLGGDTELLLVIKAYAYGHGSIRLALEAEKIGISWFGVATAGEANELRDAGVKANILIFSPIHQDMLAGCIERGIMLGAGTVEFAEEVSKAAVKLGKTAKLHIKLDTGMSRVGFRPGAEAIDGIVRISKLPNVELDGIFSHLAESDKDNDYSPLQFERFTAMLDELKQKGITFAHRHISNSGGILAGHKYNLDLARAGIILYGQPASCDYDLRALGILPFLSLKSFVSFIKTVPAGTPIGYSRTYKTDRETVVATIPFGYADGYSRDYSNKANVLIGGKRARIIGRVCMDLIMADVTDIPGVKTGDEVVLIGKQGSEEINATELAKIQDTIEYEVLTSISARVARVYENTLNK